MTAPVRMASPTEARPSEFCWSRPQEHRRAGMSGPAGRWFIRADAGAPDNAVASVTPPGLLMKMIFSKVASLAGTGGGLPKSLRFYIKAKTGRMISDNDRASGTGTGSKGASRGLPSASTVSLCNANFRRIRLGETT